MCSETTLEHEDKQHSSTFKEVAEESAPMTMVSPEADCMWAWDTLFPGRGVKSRLQCWQCVCVSQASRAKTKKKKKKIYGAFSAAHTWRLFVFSFSLSLPHYIFNYQVRREAHYLGESVPMLLFYWQQKCTKSICGDLNLLMPLGNLYE